MKKLFGKVLLSLPVLALTVCAGENSAPHGQWVVMSHKDASSGIESAAYALTGQTLDNSDRRPSIVLTCDGDREPAVVYHTDVQLASQAHDVMNRYSDSIWVTVKVDNVKPYRALWEMVDKPDHREAVLDKKTLRYLLAGERMRVVFRDFLDEEHSDEFELAGLNVSDLKPFCAARWLAKNDLSDASRSSHVSRRR